MDIVEKLRTFDNFNYADKVNILLTAADHIEQVRQALIDAQSEIESLKQQLVSKNEPVGEVCGNEYIHYLENDDGEPMPDLANGTQVFL